MGQQLQPHLRRPRAASRKHARKARGVGIELLAELQAHGELLGREGESSGANGSDALTPCLGGGGSGVCREAGVAVTRRLTAQGEERAEVDGWRHTPK